MNAGPTPRKLLDVLRETRTVDASALRQLYPRGLLAIVPPDRAAQAKADQTLRIPARAMLFGTQPGTGSVDRSQPRNPRALFATPEALAFTIEKTRRNPFGFVSIGRAPNNDVVLPWGSVSKVHLMINMDGMGATIADARSTNGTWLNGVPLRGEPRPLAPGDYLVVGGEVRALYLDTSAIASFGAEQETSEGGGTWAGASS